MLPQPVPVSPHEALPLLARLYGAADSSLVTLSAELTAAWTLHGPDGEPLGALGLRPTPAHGSELVGRAFPGTRQHQAASLLVRAALAEHSALYAYAEAHLLPESALAAVGLHRVSAYTRMAGPLPDAGPESAPEFRFVPLSEAGPAERLTAQRFYSDRLGHTAVPPEAGEAAFGGSDDRLGLLARDDSGQVAGLCRLWLEGAEASLTTPAIRPDLRGGTLRQALLLSMLAAARRAGAERVALEAWGDTEADRRADAALGLTLETLTPIYAASP